MLISEGNLNQFCSVQFQLQFHWIKLGLLQAAHLCIHFKRNKKWCTSLKDLFHWEREKSLAPGSPWLASYLSLFEFVVLGPPSCWTPDRPAKSLGHFGGAFRQLFIVAQQFFVGSKVARKVFVGTRCGRELILFLLVEALFWLNGHFNSSRKIGGGGGIESNGRFLVKDEPLAFFIFFLQNFEAWASSVI